MTNPNENVLDPARSEEYSNWLRKMIMIRRFEEAAGEAYAIGHVGGFCHLYVGQEAVAVGSIAALEEDDVIMCSYREHGHALARRRGPRDRVFRRPSRPLALLPRAAVEFRALVA